MEVRSKFDELKKSLPNPLPTPGMLHCYNYISLTSFHCYCSPVSGSGCEGNNNIGYVEPLRLQHHSALHTLIQTNNFHTREMWRHLLVLSHYDLKKRQGNLNKLSASRGFSNMQPSGDNLLKNQLFLFAYLISSMKTLTSIQQSGWVWCTDPLLAPPLRDLWPTLISAGNNKK